MNLPYQVIHIRTHMHKCTFLSHTKFLIQCFDFWICSFKHNMCIRSKPLQCTSQIQYQFFKVDFVFLIKIYTKWIYSYASITISFVNRCIWFIYKEKINPYRYNINANYNSNSSRLLNDVLKRNFDGSFRNHYRCLFHLLSAAK